VIDPSTFSRRSGEGTLGLQLGTISLSLLDRVGVRSLLFSRRYSHGYKVSSKYARPFFLPQLDTKTTYIHAWELRVGPKDVMCKVMPWQ